MADENDPYGLVGLQAQPDAAASDPYGLIAAQTGDVQQPSAASPPVAAGNGGNYSSARGFFEGLRAPLDAGAQMLVHALPDRWVQNANQALGSDLAPTTKELDKQIAARGAEYSADRAAAGKTGLDWPYMAGNVVGSAPLAAATPELEGAPLLAKAANVLGSGYAYGTAAPVTGDTSDFWSKKNTQGEVGAVTNAAIAPVAKALSAVISPSVSGEAKTLMDEGVTPTPGQLLGGMAKTVEDKLTSIPFLGDTIKNAQNRTANDLNQAVANRALAPIGESITAAPGRDMVEEVSDKLSAAYDDVLPKLTFKPDVQYTSELQNIIGMAKFMPEPQAKQFDNILKNKLFARMGPNGIMDGQTLKGVESELRLQAQGYLKDPSFDNRQLGSAIQETLNSMRGALQRNNPQYAPRLADINRGYANYAILRKAASNLGQSTEPGVFSPSQLQSAVKASDQSVAKGNFARGNALMQNLSDPALKVLGGKYPDSGTPGRAALALGGAAILGHEIHPAIPFAIGAASLPYTRMGQNVMATLIARRPDLAGPLANAVQKSAPFIGAGVSPAASQFAPFSLYGGAQ